MSCVLPLVCLFDCPRVVVLSSVMLVFVRQDAVSPAVVSRLAARLCDLGAFLFCRLDRGWLCVWSPVVSLVAASVLVLVPSK